MFLGGSCLLELRHLVLNFDIILTYVMDLRIELGRIQTSDGSTKAYTVISDRWVGKSSCIGGGMRLFGALVNCKSPI